MRTYIVSWCFYRLGDDHSNDYWIAAESYTEARKAYRRALDAGADIATISQVVESTDYEAGGDVCLTS